MLKNKIFKLFLMVPVILLFHNCDSAFEANSLSYNELASSIPLNDQVNFKGLSWIIEWSDEFNGAMGDKPQKPWHFYLNKNQDNPEDESLWTHRQGLLTDKDAFMDGESNLKMRALIRGDKVNHSFLRSAEFVGKDNSLAKDLPTNYLLDPSKGPLYIETSIKLDNAYQSEDAWWAFWLFAPQTYGEGKKVLWGYHRTGSPLLHPYDSDPDTGMEIDIFEYVPYLGNSEYESRNGFNMALFTSVDNSTENTVVRALHMTTSEPKGFVPELNRFLSEFKTPAKQGQVELTDGNFHTIGMYWDQGRYEFYIDGNLIWEVNDKSFITKARANAIILSWEVQNGLWGDSKDKTFASNDREVFVLIDYVRVYRARTF